MKYFSLQAWIEGNTKHDEKEEDRFVEETINRIKSYKRYFESIRQQLPKEFLNFLETIRIHDGHLREVSVDVLNGVVNLEFDASDITGQEFRQVKSVYGDTMELSLTSDPEMGLPGPHGFGDLGNDECELFPDGYIEHRMIFSSGIELAVKFRTFSFTVIRDKRELSDREIENYILFQLSNMSDEDIKSSDITSRLEAELRSQKLLEEESYIDYFRNHTTSLLKEALRIRQNSRLRIVQDLLNKFEQIETLKLTFSSEIESSMKFLEEKLNDLLHLTE